MKIISKLSSLPFDRVIRFFRDRDYAKTSFVIMNAGLAVLMLSIVYAVYVQIFSMFRLPWIYVCCLFGSAMAILFARYKMLSVIDMSVRNNYSTGKHRGVGNECIGYMVISTLLSVVFFSFPGDHLDLILTSVTGGLDIVGSVLFLPYFSNLREPKDMSSPKNISLYNYTKRFVDIIPM